MKKMQCFGCGVEEDVRAEGLPAAWGQRNINGDTVPMCSCCNDTGNWIGGISPALKEEIETTHGFEVFEAA